MPLFKERADERELEYRYKGVWGHFPPGTKSCEKCREKVGLHQRVKMGFTTEHLQYAKDLCIDCAVQECDFYRGLTNLGVKGSSTRKDECMRKLRRAEKVKQWIK
jgi:hypothetical protein